MKKGGSNNNDFDAKFAKYAARLNKGGTAQNTKPKGLTQEQKVKQAIRTGQKVEVVYKGTSNKHSEVKNVGKLLNEDIEIKTVPREISTQVMQVRNEKKLSQEQLANKISESVSVIKNLESGNGVYDPKIVEKIERTLGVKFTRSWKKSN